MASESVLPANLRSIADRFIARALHGRIEALRIDLYRRDVEATRRGVADEQYYRHEQEVACIQEYDERLHAVWASYRRVIVEAGLPWTTELRREIDHRIEAQSQADLSYIEEMARGHITSHGHGFTLFLHDSSKELSSGLAAEIDLFATRYQALGATLMNALQAPRYSGPLMHWTEARKAMRQSPPDGLRAARAAVSSLEGIARIVVGDPKATLGDCIKSLRAQQHIDGATAKSLESLWGFSSDSPGIRHGATARVELPVAEAEYVIDAVEASGKLLLSLDAIDI